MRIPFCNLISTMFNLLYILGSLGAANCRQGNVDEFLRTEVGFGYWTQQALINSRRLAGKSFKICCLKEEARRLRELLDASNAQFCHLRIQFHSMSTTLNNKKSKLSALAQYNCMTIEIHRIFPDIDYGRDAKRGRALDFYNGFSFQRSWYDEGKDNSLISIFLSFSLNYVAPRTTCASFW